MMQKLMNLLGVNVQEQVEPETVIRCRANTACPNTGEAFLCDGSGCEPAGGCC